MTKLEASQVRCHVLTYKEGLLSAVAHDLWIDVTRMSVEVDGAAGKVEATFDATSLAVRCAMKDGAERPDALSAKDKRDIEDNIAKDVLGTKKHKEIRFRSRSVTAQGSGYVVSGTLELKGSARDVSFDLRPVGEQLEAKVRIHQPDFGIKPYSAMLGALKIKPDVDVILRVAKGAVS
jgi:polyisoprenoid-binding protein YceI